MPVSFLSIIGPALIGGPGRLDWIVGRLHNHSGKLDKTRVASNSQKVTLTCLGSHASTHRIRCREFSIKSRVCEAYLSPVTVNSTDLVNSYLGASGLSASLLAERSFRKDCQ